MKKDKFRLNSIALSFTSKLIVSVFLVSSTLTYACNAPIPGSLAFLAGQTSTFLMSCDDVGCVSDLNASSTDLNIVTVSPANYSNVGTASKTFTVSGVNLGNANINIVWQCPGDMSASTSTVAVSIVAPAALASGLSTANTTYAGSAAEPVNTFTGELYNQYDADLNLHGPLALRFARYYGSAIAADGITTGTLGTNWRHNFDWQLSDNGSQIEILAANGALIEFSDNAGLWVQSGNITIKYQLAENGGEFTLLDVKNKQLYIFSATGLLISISDGRGNQHLINYNGSDQITSITDGLGRTLTFVNTGNRLTSITDGTRTINFGYTGDDLTSSSSALGHVTSYSYGGGGLMTSMTRPAGNTTITQMFNGSDQVTSQTDGVGDSISLSYDAGNVTNITNAAADVSTHTHTASGELSNIQDANGNSVAIASNADGQRSSITDRLGGNSSYTYHSESGRLDTATEVDGTSTSNSYSTRVGSNITQYDLTAINHSDGSNDSFGYDASGNLVSKTDRAGNITTHTYNGNGQILTTTNTAGGVTSTSWNADQTAASTQDPAGNTISFGYDGLRRINLVTFADANSRQLTYDTDDQLLDIIDANSNSSSFGYDNNGNLTSVTDPLSKTRNFTYDGNDRLLTVTVPLGGVSSWSYNQIGKIASASDANNNSTSFTYDALERLTSVTDPLGNVWGSSYNSEAILTSYTDPLFNTRTFDSDNMGRITGTTSPLGASSTLTYDTMGRVSSTTNALNQTTSYNRDSRGLISSITLPNNVISVSYNRNSFGQMTSITDPVDNDWLRSYDSMGRLTASTDPLGRAQTVSYDNRNRLSSINYPSGFGTVSKSYDAVGNLTGNNFSDGTILSYTYDANNRQLTGTGLSAIYDDNGRLSSSNGIANTRDAAGRIVTMTLATGKTISYGYDANDQLTSVSDWAGGITNFSYDVAGRLTAISRPNTSNGSYTYDNDNRLLGIIEGSHSITLLRDLKGQIISATRNLPEPATATLLSSTIHEYDAAAQLNEASYDVLGRITASGTDSYSWNLATQLTNYSVGGVTATASYDGNNRRLSRTVAASTRNYLWNDALGLASISVEKNGATDLKYYVHSPAGTLLYSIDAITSARNFYHYDEMGNTIFVTNDAGIVIGSYAYGPFGEIISQTGGLDNPFTWQGQFGVMDETNGLYYMRARFYDSRTARFISRDPVKSASPKAINPYQYALNNPLGFIDPSGLETDEFLDEGATLFVAVLAGGFRGGMWEAMKQQNGVMEDNGESEFSKEYNRRMEKQLAEFKNKTATGSGPKPPKTEAPMSTITTSSQPAKQFAKAFQPSGLENATSRFYGIDSRFPGTVSCESTSVCDSDIGEHCSQQTASGGSCIPTWFGVAQAWAPAAVMNDIEIQSLNLKSVEPLSFGNSSNPFRRKATSVGVGPDFGTLIFLPVIQGN